MKKVGVGLKRSHRGGVMSLPAEMVGHESVAR